MGVAHQIAGHRTVLHTADLRIEAWAPTREECLAEAVRGLAESFAAVAGRRPQGRASRRMTAHSDADLLVVVIDEVPTGWMLVARSRSGWRPACGRWRNHRAGVHDVACSSHSDLPRTGAVARRHC